MELTKGGYSGSGMMTHALQHPLDVLMGLQVHAAPC